MTIQSHPVVIKTVIAFLGWLIVFVAELQGVFAPLVLKVELWLQSLGIGAVTPLTVFPERFFYLLALAVMFGVSFVAASDASFLSKLGVAVFTGMVTFFGVFVAALWGSLLVPFSWVLGGGCCAACVFLMEQWQKHHQEGSSQGGDEDNVIHLNRVEPIVTQERKVSQEES